ncbi:MAG: Uncharacterised protein [Opitutia bacterium UBA7350]|nr:MAG: Uncharacterised protein [Opitutae bacterium UBA7350]
MNKFITFLTLLCITSFIHTGVAADSSNHESISENSAKLSGYFGASLARNYLRENDGNNPDNVNASETRFDAGFSYALNGYTTILSGSYRDTNFSSSNDFDNGEDPDWQYGVGLRFLKELNKDTKLGFLVSYDDTRSQNEPIRDEYDVLLTGVEFQKFLHENIFIGVQFGVADKVRDGQDVDEGFNNGLFGRFVGSYFFSKHSLLTIDFELAGCKNYIDSSDPGRFFGVGLNYQQQFKDDSPLTFIVYGQFDHISSTDEGDAADELILGIGFQYRFGAESPYALTRSGASLGLPKLPGRASAWTEWAD